MVEHGDTLWSFNLEKEPFVDDFPIEHCHFPCQRVSAVLNFTKEELRFGVFFWMRMDADLPHLHGYNVRPPFDSVQLVNITPMSLWFMVRK